MGEQFPRSSIRLFVQILGSEGSAVPAAINAASLALADAGIPMRDLVVASTAGMLGKHVAVDLNREEEMSGGAQITIAALAGTRQITLMEVESKVPEGHLPILYEAALGGCDRIAEQMRASLFDHATNGFSLRTSLRTGQKN